MNDPAVYPPPCPESNTPAEPSFLLTSLEVFNWGPFQGKHRCEIDSGGSAIIGPTGSGKTTLVDALMTLLAHFPRYNLASTGGHESDRDLISYIRGVSGADSVGKENDHVARPGKTITGLAATYLDGSAQVCIGAVLWVDSSSYATEDLKKVWFFARDMTQPLDQLLRLHHEEGKQAMMRHARETVGMQIFGSKKDYLSQVRGFFEVGDNAFSLLNRAAGLKQINSIDQIFRELVLDDRSAFDRALQVAAEFDTLQGIHNELEMARRQRDSLVPVETHQATLQMVTLKLNLRYRLKELHPIWFAQVASNLWNTEANQIGEKLAAANLNLKSADDEANSCQSHADTLREKYLHLGGSTILELEANISTKQKFAESIRKNSRDYQQFTMQLGLSDSLTEDGFQNNLSLLPERRVATQQEYDIAHEATLATESSLRDSKLEAEAVEHEVREIKARPHSNIPVKYQGFREQLAVHLGVEANQIPFLAELVEVQAEEGRWRGAIERAIGAERLRILVSTHYVSKALTWINSRDNRIHVRLQEVDPTPRSVHFFEDGFTRKLNFREHPMQESVKYLLSKRDRHCVGSIEALKITEFGMTVEGTMSERSGRFEKQDQSPLAEGWMTGFDNSHQLQSLARRREEIRIAMGSLQSESAMRRAVEETLHARLTIIQQLQRLEFAEIDLPCVERELKDQQERLIALTRPDSDTALAKQCYEATLAELERLRNRSGELREELGGLKTALQNAQEEHQKAMNRRGEGLNDEDTVLATKAFPISESQTVKLLVDVERAALKQIEEEIRSAEQQESDIEKKLIRAMEGAQREDTGALTETGTELRDVPEYLKRLKVLQEEALPEKLKRFLDYLNHSSGQGVTQLLTHIDNEVRLIEERIADLNATLSRVDFRPGQFLRLVAERNVHESLRQIETAHRKLRFIALKAEDDQGEAHYKALGEVIGLLREAGENRRPLGAQALLDPRHRLQFFVVEVDRLPGERMAGELVRKPGAAVKRK